MPLYKKIVYKQPKKADRLIQEKYWTEKSNGRGLRKTVDQNNPQSTLWDCFLYRQPIHHFNVFHKTLRHDVISYVELEMIIEKKKTSQNKNSKKNDKISYLNM